MKKFFSPSNIGFYIEGLNSQIPDDAVAVTDEIYAEYTNVAWPERMIMGSDDNGFPVWKDAPPLTDDEVISLAFTERTGLRIIADSEIAWREDAVNAGIASETETTELAKWKTYRVMLMRVDLLKPVWPEPPKN